MGCSYSIDGKFKVRNNPESRALLESLQDAAGDIEVVESYGPDETIDVMIYGQAFCTYTTATDLDERIKEFGPHVVGTAKLQTDCDGERGDLWLGTAEAVAAAQREESFDQIRIGLRGLAPEDRLAVLGLGGVPTDLAYVSGQLRLAVSGNTAVADCLRRATDGLERIEEAFKVATAVPPSSGE